jgi:surfeit locus 1 family protein
VKPAPTRSTATLVVMAICGTLLFAIFVALGGWQIQRLIWKRELIARVEQRVHASAVAAPDRLRWPQVTAESDEYRHVRVSGVFLDAATTKVLASTVFGRGFWVMTPLQVADGSIIFVNRGFIPENVTSPTLPAAGEITGLLRISESGGAFLHNNDPDHQLWYSRDVQAIAAAHHLADVAPYFIDADATPTDNKSQPVGGLTVIAFNNNHLVYTLTWFALALMVAGACYYLVRSELKVRRRQHEK